MCDWTDSETAAGDSTRSETLASGRNPGNGLQLSTHRNRSRGRLGYTIPVPVLQAIAAEYLLTRLAGGDRETYLKTHNLNCLYADLELTIRNRLG